MKSSYTDNFMHKIVFIPPTYMKKGKPVQAKPIVLAHKGSKEEAVKYCIDATDRMSKRPGLVRIIPPSNVPQVGRNYAGKSMASAA